MVFTIITLNKNIVMTTKEKIGYGLAGAAVLGVIVGLVATPKGKKLTKELGKKALKFKDQLKAKKLNLEPFSGAKNNLFVPNTKGEMV